MGVWEGGGRREGWRCEGGRGERRPRVMSTPPASASLDCSARTGHPVTAGMDAVCARSAQWRGQRRRAERGGMRNTLPSATPSISLSPSLFFSLLRMLRTTRRGTQGKRGGWQKETLLNSIAKGGDHSGGRWMRVGEVGGGRGVTLAACRRRLELRVFRRTRRRRRVE